VNPGPLPPQSLLRPQLASTPSRRGRFPPRRSEHHHHHPWLLVPFGLLTAGALPGAAQAQVDPEGGDTGAWQAPPVTRTEAEGSGDPDRETGARSIDEIPLARDIEGGGDEDDPSYVPADLPDVQDPARFTDHHDAVGRVGVGFFGVFDVVSGPIDPTSGDLTRIDAPSLGVRHWLDDLIGVQAAVGLGFRNVSVDFDGEGDNLGSSFGLVFHGGLPVTLYHYKHYAFLVIPEVNLGFGGGSAPSAIGANGDDDFFGVLFDLGVRLGAEVHFGFIGIPDLSLQAAVGARLRVEFARQTRCVDDACDETAEDSVTITSITTALRQDPWDIFTGAITAIYYF